MIVIVDIEMLRMSRPLCHCYSHWHLGKGKERVCMMLPIICDRATAGFSCVSCKVNTKTSGQSFEA